MHQLLEFEDMEREYFLHSPETPREEIEEPQRSNEVQEVAQDVHEQVFNRHAPAQSENRWRRVTTSGEKFITSRIARALIAGTFATTSGIYAEKHFEASSPTPPAISTSMDSYRTPTIGGAVAMPLNTRVDSTPAGTVQPVMPSSQAEPGHGDSAMKDMGLGLGGIGLGASGIGLGLFAGSERGKRFGRNMKERLDRIKGKRKEVWDESGNMNGQTVREDHTFQESEVASDTEEKSDQNAEPRRILSLEELDNQESPKKNISEKDARKRLDWEQEKERVAKQGIEQVEFALQRYRATSSERGQGYKDLLEDLLRKEYAHYELTHRVEIEKPADDEAILGGYLVRELKRIDLALESTEGPAVNVLETQRRSAVKYLEKIAEGNIREAELYITQKARVLKAEYAAAPGRRDGIRREEENMVDSVGLYNPTLAETIRESFDTSS